MTETPFDRAYGWLRFGGHGWDGEGGFSRDPHDTAAAAEGTVEPSAIHTAYGITQRTYTAWRVSKGDTERPVALIEEDEVAAIYRDEFWREYWCDRVATFAPNLALCLFDGYVQHRPKENTRLWQNTVQSEPDGIVGPDTLCRTQYQAKRVGEELVCAAYLARRRQHYIGIIQRDPTQQRFRKGWRMRLNALCTEVGIDPAWAA